MLTMDKMINIDKHKVSKKHFKALAHRALPNYMNGFSSRQQGSSLLSRTFFQLHIAFPLENAEALDCRISGCKAVIPPQL